MTTIDLNSYQLFNGGFKVYSLSPSARVLVQDPNGLWFMAQKKDGLQFSPVYGERKVLTVGSLQSISGLCRKFDTREAALAARPWEC